MEKEENVCVETLGTEETMTSVGSAVLEADAGRAVGEETAEKKASAVWKKFKDADALASAYEALEAEFTRRSQRLKVLEKAAENREEMRVAAAEKAEKLKERAVARKAEMRAFDDFVFDMGKAHTQLQDRPEALENAAGSAQPLCGDKIANDGGRYALNEENSMVTMPEKREGSTEETRIARGAEFGSVTGNGRSVGAEEVHTSEWFSAVAMHGNTGNSSEELFRAASRDEGVRLRIIGEYLASIKKTGAPLTASGAGMPVSPALKARSIGDAGSMALLYFKEPCKNR